MTFGNMYTPLPGCWGPGGGLLGVRQGGGTPCSSGPVSMHRIAHNSYKLNHLLKLNQLTWFMFHNRAPWLLNM